MEAKQEKTEPTTVVAYKGFDKDLKCRGYTLSADGEFVEVSE